MKMRQAELCDHSKPQTRGRVGTLGLQNENRKSVNYAEKKRLQKALAT